MTAKPKKFFTQKGKTLKASTDKTLNNNTTTSNEVVNSLFDQPIIENKTDKIKKHVLFERFRKINLSRLGRNAATTWASVCVVLIFGFLISVMVTPSKARPFDVSRYAIYASVPPTLEQATSNISAQDSRAQKLDSVFKIYKCPLEGLGQTFVYEADKNHIPWWLVASIAFQESSCGKSTPKINGQESYNAWGWAVYGELIKGFENFEKGISTVSAYINDQFISRGVTDTCEIMKTYTPGSNGSWCYGVNHFAEIIQNYKTPEL